MAWLIYRIPFGLWKALDSFIYLVIAYLLSYLFEKRYFSWFCLGVCCFPIEKYLSTAGYIVCTTNYIYPFLGLLLIATIAYLINFFIPGHIYRMTSDDYYWISDFGTWSLAKKSITAIHQQLQHYFLIENL
jgi:hypothetical protein